jgi:hypothetical protein
MIHRASWGTAYRMRGSIIARGYTCPAAAGWRDKPCAIAVSFHGFE